MEEVKCDCMGTHKCDLKNCWSTLLTILTQEFNLQVEGCADPLHLTDILPRYVSSKPDHGFFGAEMDVLTIDLGGTSTFLNPPFTGRMVWEQKNQHIMSIIIQRWARWVKGNKPTRAIMIIPEPTASDGQVFIREALEAGGRLFFTIERGQSCFVSPTAFRDEKTETWGIYSGRVHFVIFQNQAADIVHPVWSDELGKRLRNWGDTRKIAYKYFPIPSTAQQSQLVKKESGTRYPVLRLYGRMAPSTNQVEQLVPNKRMRGWIKDFNKEDKLAIRAGFVPPACII